MIGWAFRCLKDVMNHYGIQEPSVALHDRDRALIHGFNRAFPRVHHLLCLWHMDADAKASVSSIFEGEEQEAEGGGHESDSTSQGEAFLAHYYCLLYAKTVEAFDAAWNELKGKDAGEKWQRAAHYVESQWFKHHKELCVKSWTDNVRHSGTSTTSVVEGAHANLNCWLQTSHNDFLGFFEKMQSFYDHQIDRYDNALTRAQSQGVTPFINNPFYRLCLPRTKPPSVIAPNFTIISLNMPPHARIAALALAALEAADEQQQHRRRGAPELTQQYCRIRRCHPYSYKDWTLDGLSDDYRAIKFRFSKAWNRRRGRERREPDRKGMDLDCRHEQGKAGPCKSKEGSGRACW